MAPKAKTASKNAPSNRGQSLSFIYKNEKGQEFDVAPARYIDIENKKDFTAMEDKKTNQIILNSEGNPLDWSFAKKK